MNEARNGSKFLGRDHHPHAFALWMAGGGVQGNPPRRYGQAETTPPKNASRRPRSTKRRFLPPWGWSTFSFDLSLSKAAISG